MLNSWKNTFSSIYLSIFIHLAFGIPGTLTWLFIIALAYHFKDILLYPRKRHIVYHIQDNPQNIKNPEEIGLEVLYINIITEDGVVLKGWLFSKPENKRIVVYFHGLFVEIWQRLMWIKYFFEQTQSDILIISYRGFSQNQGKPSMKGLKIDARAIMQYAVSFQNSQEVKGRHKNIYVYGRSMGGAISIYLMAQTSFKFEVKGLILENTFVSYQQEVLNLVSYFPFLALIGIDQWNSRKHMGKINIPILFIRSLKDKVIAPWQMIQLVNLATNCPLKMEYKVRSGTHAPVWFRNPKFYAYKIIHFFDRIEKWYILDQ